MPGTRQSCVDGLSAASPAPSHFTLPPAHPPTPGQHWRHFHFTGEGAGREGFSHPSATAAAARQSCHRTQVHLRLVPKRSAPVPSWPWQACRGAPSAAGSRPQLQEVTSRQGAPSLTHTHPHERPPAVPCDRHTHGTPSVSSGFYPRSRAGQTCLPRPGADSELSRGGKDEPPHLENKEDRPRAPGQQRPPPRSPGDRVGQGPVGYNRFPRPLHHPAPRARSITPKSVSASSLANWLPAAYKMMSEILCLCKLVTSHPSHAAL